MQTRILAVATDLDIAEYEEVVIGTEDMPPDLWRRAYAFGFLLSALANLEVADVLLLVLRDLLEVDLRDWVDGVLDGLEEAPDGSAMAGVNRALQRHLLSVERGGPLSLIVPEIGASHDADVAMALAAWTAGDSLYDELLACTLATDSMPSTPTAQEILAEAFELQKLATPQWQAGPARQRTFEFDWLPWLSARWQGGKPSLQRRRATIVAASWSPVAVQDQRTLLRGRLAAIYAKQAAQRLMAAPAQRTKM